MDPLLCLYSFSIGQRLSCLYENISLGVFMTPGQVSVKNYLGSINNVGDVLFLFDSSLQQTAFNPGCLLKPFESTSTQRFLNEVRKLI